MSNVINALPVNGLNPVTVGGTGTAVKYFPTAPGASIGVASTAVGQLNLPGSSRLNGQVFNVIATGNVFATGTALMTLSANTAAQGVTPSYTIVATSGAVTPTASTTTSWCIKASMYGDSASGVVSGTFQVYFNGLLTASTTILTNNLTGINFASEYPFGLVVGVTFGTSSSTSLAKLFQFQLEA